ncbi:MAG: putative metal-binding motif-containing protein [bacterium]|nr:putative metal-binding motif-containing protein [bacterium]
MGGIIGYVAHSGGLPPRRECRERYPFDDENGDNTSHLHFGIRLGPAPLRADGRYDWVYFGYAGSGQDVDFDAAGRPHGGKFTSPVKFLARFGVTPPHTDDDSDGFSENDGDCNDADKFVRPDTFERCENGKDDNCDGVTDEESHPLGEQCLFKYNGCLVSGAWVCINGQTLCKPGDINDCICRDECEDVGVGTCGREGDNTSARICAVDHATGCTRWIYQQCVVCNGGRCVRQGQGGICTSDDDCEQNLGCVQDGCAGRQHCAERCETRPFEVQHGDCPGCLTCTSWGYCVNGRGVRGAALGLGCPCASVGECSTGFDDGQLQCADGLACLTCVFGARFPVRGCDFGGDVECKCLPNLILIQQPNTCEGW